MRSNSKVSLVLKLTGLNLSLYKIALEASRMFHISFQTIFSLFGRNGTKERNNHKNKFVEILETQDRIPRLDTVMIIIETLRRLLGKNDVSEYVELRLQIGNRLLKVKPVVEEIILSSEETSDQIQNEADGNGTRDSLKIPKKDPSLV